MLFTEQILDKVYAHSISLAEGLETTYCATLTSSSCDFHPIIWWSIGIRRLVLLIFVEHILYRCLVEFGLRTKLAFLFFFLVKHHYEIQVFSNWEKLPALESMRPDKFEEGATSDTWILKDIFIDVYLY